MKGYHTYDRGSSYSDRKNLRIFTSLRAKLRTACWKTDVCGTLVLIIRTVVQMLKTPASYERLPLSRSTVLVPPILEYCMLSNFGKSITRKEFKSVKMQKQKIIKNNILTIWDGLFEFFFFLSWINAVLSWTKHTKFLGTRLYDIVKSFFLRYNTGTL